jgi:hypothetical protein
MYVGEKGFILFLMDMFMGMVVFVQFVMDASVSMGLGKVEKAGEKENEQEMHVGRG